MIADVILRWVACLLVQTSVVRLLPKRVGMGLLFLALGSGASSFLLSTYVMPDYLPLISRLAFIASFNLLPLPLVYFFPPVEAWLEAKLRGDEGSRLYLLLFPYALKGYKGKWVEEVRFVPFLEDIKVRVALSTLEEPPPPLLEVAVYVRPGMEMEEHVLWSLEAVIGAFEEEGLKEVAEEMKSVLLPHLV